MKLTTLLVITAIAGAACGTYSTVSKAGEWDYDDDSRYEELDRRDFDIDYDLDDEEYFNDGSDEYLEVMEEYNTVLSDYDIDYTVYASYKGDDAAYNGHNKYNGECLLQGWKAQLAWDFDLTSDSETMLIKQFAKTWMNVLPTCEDNFSLVDHKKTFRIFLIQNGDIVLRETGRFVMPSGNLSPRH